MPRCSRVAILGLIAWLSSAWVWERVEKAREPPKFVELSDGLYG